MTSVVKNTIVNPDGLYDPEPNGYSHVVISTGGSGIVHFAGQGGEDKDGILSPEFAKQVEQAFENLRIAFAAANVQPNQVAKLTTFVVGYDQSQLDVMTLHVRKTFGKALPAQSLVPVPRLALDGMLFEVEAVAIID
ncbi:RidA family protein [Moritella sp. F3]|uniref:RidA family protein n=1 Tax=Moritella sp. F3 TaxID=2718882 RepID=UPI0018E165CB|nr:RidA family protein [Moritella sp. F3]GIC75288.1 enamine deaminase RidA [Moritella sp. F1]GIC80433.1 enamine deaminase RidA [Moritella sp. F3]